MIKAIIFDVDGVMVDSEPLHVRAWDEALHIYSHKLIDLSETLTASMAGKKPIAIAEEMVAELQLTLPASELLSKKKDIFETLAKTELKPMTGIVKTVQELKQAGYKLGIGTSLNREYIKSILSSLSLTDYFDVVVTGDEIKNGKPHPDTYITVAKKLNVKPEACVVIEDATTGIKSAKAAGCYCIALLNQNAQIQDTSEADKMILSLSEVKNVIASLR